MDESGSYRLEIFGSRGQRVDQMGQVHQGGEKRFVDGKKPSILDLATDEVIAVELFVAVLLSVREDRGRDALALWVELTVSDVQPIVMVCGASVSGRTVRGGGG